jgi:Tol biopolymer transport system component
MTTPPNDLLERAMRLFPAPERGLEQVRRRQERRQRNRRLGASVIGLVIALGLIVGAAAVIDSEPRPAHSGPTGPHPSTASPTIAFTAWDVPGGDPNDEQVFVARPDGTVTQITHGDNHRAVTWSPDGSRLLVLRGNNNEIWSIAPDGSSATRLTEVPNRYGSLEANVHFSPDGSQIAYQRDRGLFVMDATGSDQTRIASGLDDFFFAGSADFSWSPDGSRIVFASGYRGIGGLFTVRPDGTDLKPLGTGGLAGAEHPSWSPDGSMISFVGFLTADTQNGSGDGTFVMDLDGSDPVRIATGYSPMWSPDGSKIVVSQNGPIFVVAPDGSRGVTLVGCGPLGHDWSPDGSQLLVVGTVDPRGNGGCLRGVYLDQVDLSSSEPLTQTKLVGLPHPARILDPLWQPSG